MCKYFVNGCMSECPCTEQRNSESDIPNRKCMSKRIHTHTHICTGANTAKKKLVLYSFFLRLLECDIIRQKTKSMIFCVQSSVSVRVRECVPVSAYK